jgi:hypothetical protein
VHGAKTSLCVVVGIRMGADLHYAPSALQYCRNALLLGESCNFRSSYICRLYSMPLMVQRIMIERLRMTR